MFDAGVSRDLSNELIKVRKICSFHIHADGDTIHTENSYKFAVEDFRALGLARAIATRHDGMMRLQRA